MNDSKKLAQVSLMVLLILGCLLVLYPFLVAILFAGVLCVTLWPAYRWLHRLLRGKDTLSALAMTALLIVMIVAPTVLLSYNLGEAAHLAVSSLAPRVQEIIAGTPPAWLHKLPWGEQLADYWRQLTENHDALMNLLQQAQEPIRKVAMASIGLVSNGILQLLLVIFIGFFLFRDGMQLAEHLRRAARRLGGDLGEEMLMLARGTVNGVMIGIVGTALAQAVVAFIGFVVAGVPGALLLGMGTFLLSMIPVGPPLIWGGAAFWLYSQGETGWAIGMVVYGLAVISSVDNFVKPILISRTASLPILLIALGVFGGILAFGFIGIFLGPPLLALGHTLFLRWVRQPEAVG
ncbi:MAG: AI-2E family transporter [Zoogloeaceae bacterium]|jgi:predicted PurR-regulated permease PerM|nr:AI-2E family transporter [Zoogloeaceae bacterium]